MNNCKYCEGPLARDNDTGVCFKCKAERRRAFTPAPWNVFHWDNQTHIEGVGRQDVCTMRFCKEEKANATLIATAPELLEALEEAVEIVDSISDGDYIPDSFTTQPWRAAIAKARGER